MSDYTMFCWHVTRSGTIWIGEVEAEDLECAKYEGQIKCAQAWGYPVEDVFTLCVIEGHVNVLYFNEGEE